MTATLPLLTLADRVQALTSACRETDRLIFEAALFESEIKRRGASSWFCAVDGSSYGFNFDDAPTGSKVTWCGELPRYTASLDVAMTLVPKGRYWHVGHGRTRDDEPLGGASIIEAGTLFTIAEAEAATAELALTAAALRAHAYDASRARAALENSNG